VRNLTVSLPDDVYRAARIRAAERGTSVSALVGAYLESLSERETTFARLERRERELRRRIGRFRAGENLSRDELHSRAVR
jgi:plasmid stability protein